MGRETELQLPYIKNRMNEFRKLCEFEMLSDSVSLEVKNLFQDISGRLNKLIDAIVFEYFEREIAPTLEPIRLESLARRVQFPIAPDMQNHANILRGFGIVDAERTHPRLWVATIQYQSFTKADAALPQLRKYANLQHRKLIGQVKRKDVTVKLGESLRIRAGSVIMNNCVVDGKRVEKLTVKDGMLSGRVETGLNVETETKVHYLIEGTDVNVFDLLSRSLHEIVEIDRVINLS